MSNDFVEAVAACLTYPDPPGDDVKTVVRRVLFDRLPEKEDDPSPPPPSRRQLNDLQAAIDSVLPGHDRIALVYGGATKIKGYVFEAPKLPEIRGASALLDWVNEVALNDLWYDTFGPADSDRTSLHPHIVYASGGNILAFAPAEKGQELATAIEHCYTESTLTANSVAVCETFSLLELRYGRRPLAYWVEDFVKDWADERTRPLLEQYYYLPEGVDPNDTEALTRRFYNRKTFGELVTVLATMFNRRRDERAYAGEPRSVPFYPMLPWAEKCDSSDIRPVVVTTLVGSDSRSLSEPSARKLAAGRVAKGNVYKITDLETEIDWKASDNLIAWERKLSWERQWEAYIAKEGQGSYYGNKAAGKQVRPAKDVHEIGAPSNGYIGIIYADGNNVGRLIATLKTPERYFDTSKKLSNAARIAVFKALADYLQPVETPPDESGKPFLYPFEILSIGGDDLLLIVPGDKAFDIALTIGLTFETELAKRLPAPEQGLSSAAFQGRYSADSQVIANDYRPSIGLSAGVIIAQENAPIFFLRDLVEELLKSAKKLAKQNAQQGYYGGAVDFMVMKSITMVTDDIKAFRKAALGDGDARKQEPLRRLTARPYTWHEFAGLLETVRALQRVKMPRSQLYRIRRVMSEETPPSTIASTMEYLYTRTRLRSEVAGTLQEAIERDWRVVGTNGSTRPSIPPWLPLGRQSWETIWPDLIEAYEMVTLPEKEET